MAAVAEDLAAVVLVAAPAEGVLAVVVQEVVPDSITDMKLDIIMLM